MERTLPTRRRGFTLVEAIATIVVLAVVMGVSSRLIYAGADAYTAGSVRAELHSQLCAAMDRVVSELREVRATPSSSPVTPNISSVSATSIAWTGPDGTARTVALSGSSLNLTVGAASATALAVGLTGFTVACYDESNAALGASLSGASTAPIRRVELTVQGSAGGVSETLRTRVFLRCMVSGGSA